MPRDIHADEREKLAYLEQAIKSLRNGFDLDETEAELAERRERVSYQVALWRGTWEPRGALPTSR